MQLGIFTFLRRSHKVFPPIEPAAPVREDATTGGLATTEAAIARPAEPLILQLPQLFHSAHYGYSLTLPPGWQLDASQSIAGSPPIDRFSVPGGLRVGVWNEACHLRTLATVPLAERAGAYPLANGTVVQFAAFAPSAVDGSQFLEGRWLATGKRWTVHVQVASASQRERLMEPLGQVLATFSLDG
ncbi:MAG TPA: hypothetical protein VIU62_23565 [Chloroflexota bacterium]